MKLSTGFRTLGLCLLMAGAVSLPAAAASATAAASKTPAAESSTKKKEKSSKKTTKHPSTKVTHSEGSGETTAERDRRLKRECKGRPNAGACMGYANQ